MSWLNEYLTCQYKDGARGEIVNGIVYHDCWSLVREIRLRLGFPLLPSFGHIRNTMPRDFTRAYESVSMGMERCKPEVGAIAAVFRGNLCLHVGVVVEIDGQLAIMDISNSKLNCRWTRIPTYERSHMKVIYYR